MRKLWITLASVLAAAVLLALTVYFLVDRANETASDVAPIRIQGMWVLEHVDYGDRDGHQSFIVPVYIDVKGTRLRRTEVHLNSRPEQRGEVTLDANKEPKHLDLRLDFMGAKRTETYLYRLERGRLSICRNRKDPTQRPQTFRADKENDIIIETFERDFGGRSFGRGSW